MAFVLSGQLSASASAGLRRLSVVSVTLSTVFSAYPTHMRVSSLAAARNSLRLADSNLHSISHSLAAPFFSRSNTTLIPSTRLFSTTMSRFQNPSPPAAPQAANLSYGIAAAFLGKDQEWHATRSIHHFNPFLRIPPHKKSAAERPTSGHDAFFISPLGDSGAVAMGVADGVGGWTESGVDPADFSHALCDYMAMIAFNHRGPSNVGARALLQAGYDTVKNDKSITAGGSTAVVAVASPAGHVDVANLGDSGFIHLRLGAVHAYSEAQQHAFNTPYQLSIIPPKMAARMAAYGGAHLSDMPVNAEHTEHELRHGDVLVFASDGVWDNMFNEDILKVVSKMMLGSGAWYVGSDGAMHAAPNLSELTRLPEPRDSQMLDSKSTLQSLVASRIALTAKANSLEKRRDSPFAKAVRQAYKGQKWMGGKVDDVMVVVLIATADGARLGQPPHKL